MLLTGLVDGVRSIVMLAASARPGPTPEERELSGQIAGVDDQIAILVAAGATDDSVGLRQLRGQRANLEASLTAMRADVVREPAFAAEMGVDRAAKGVAHSWGAVLAKMDTHPHMFPAGLKARLRPAPGRAYAADPVFWASVIAASSADGKGRDGDF